MNISNEVFHINLSLGVGTKDNMDIDFLQTIKAAENYMYQSKLLEKKSSHSAIISSIKATMLEKSHETEAHAERLVTLSRKVGLSLNLSQSEIDNLELLATLHDIGKVGVADQILNKPGKLNNEEWDEMKKHPEIGYRIATSTPELTSIANYILSHHERWDGSGYPQNIAGNQIPLLSRIIAIIDAYDAMTQDRPYRKAIANKDAINEIIKNKGTQFDPEIVEIFIKNIN
jgi:HD-GYP domain-containing protein (c-di-GMP phosphodiesterase class II)